MDRNEKPWIKASRQEWTPRRLRRNQDAVDIYRDLVDILLEADSLDGALEPEELDPATLALDRQSDWTADRVAAALDYMRTAGELSTDVDGEEFLATPRAAWVPRKEKRDAHRHYMAGYRHGQQGRDPADDDDDYMRGYNAGASTPRVESPARPPGPGGGDVSEPEESETPPSPDVSTPTSGEGVASAMKASQARPRKPRIGWDAQVGTFTHLDDDRLRELAAKYPNVGDLQAEIAACAKWHHTAGTDMRSPGGRLATWLSRARQDSRPAYHGRPGDPLPMTPRRET